MHQYWGLSNLKINQKRHLENENFNPGQKIQNLLPLNFFKQWSLIPEKQNKEALVKPSPTMDFRHNEEWLRYP